MANLKWASLLFISFFYFAFADDVQSHWQVPDGTLADFTETFYNGDTLDVQWAGWDASVTDTTIEATVANLYVSSWNWNVSDYTRIISTNVAVDAIAGVSWKIMINSDVLALTPEFGLFLVNTSVEYAPDQGFILSKGFHVVEKPTTSSAVPSATSSKAHSTSTTASTPTKTASSDSSSSSNGLNRKESAGIGAGVGVAGSAIVVGLAILFLRRRRKSQAPETAESSVAYHPTPTQSEAVEVSSDSYVNHAEDYSHYQGPKSYPHEMPGNTTHMPPMPPAELPSQPYTR